MQRLKAEITDKLHSVALQELAFSLGYVWTVKSNTASEFEKGWLYLNGDGFICWNVKSIEKNISYQIVTLADLMRMRDEKMRENIAKQSGHVEYLDPKDNYDLVRAYKYEQPQKHWIEVPEGAVLYMHWITAGGNYFHDKDGNIINSDGSIRLIPWTLEGLREWRTEILWDREAATHPEPLPFVDDEPKVRFNSDAFSHKH